MERTLPIDDWLGSRRIARTDDATLRHHRDRALQDVRRAALAREIDGYEPRECWYEEYAQGPASLADRYQDEIDRRADGMPSPYTA